MNSILELVQKYNFDQLARTESGNAVLYCSPEDYRELRTLAARLAEAERKIAGALRTAGGRWCEWGSRAESVRDILQGTTDSADGSTT